ncbi:hypothetical protein TNCV_4728311 [Trichonephila clavipes]|nr:hypothetical protein TNCV_4728311 [Trichonephila clavipes]
MCPMIVQRLIQITLPAAPPEQFWQSVESVWSVVPQEHILTHLESMPRRVTAVISNNASTLATNSGRNHTSQKSINFIV